MDVDDLRAKADEQTACLMLTNPNTLGLFDENIAEIAEIVHEVGGTLYYDGANLNAIMGRSRPGRHGLRHRPRQPPQVLLASRTAAAARAPGRSPSPTGSSRSCRGPRWCAARATNGDEPTLRPRTTTGPSRSGACAGFQGNFGVFVRSYAYILSLGGDGLAGGLGDRGAERQLPAREAESGPRRQIPAGRLRPPAACTSSSSRARPPRSELGVKTLDIAKRLLDFGFHPPTVYFPLLVDEALMVEPTETETRETLDAFAEAIDEILAEAAPATLAEPDRLAQILCRMRPRRIPLPLKLFAHDPARSGVRCRAASRLVSLSRCVLPAIEFQRRLILPARRRPHLAPRQHRDARRRPAWGSRPCRSCATRPVMLSMDSGQRSSQLHRLSGGDQPGQLAPDQHS